MSESGSPEVQGLISDPKSTLPAVVYEGETIAVYDVVWRSGDGGEGSNVRGFASKTLIINRIEIEDEKYIYRTYKAYFTYSVDNSKDILTNEYNCKASRNEYTFFDFTFLRGGEHFWMEKPRFFFPDPPLLDDDENQFMGLCMVFRKTDWEQVIIGGWAKLRNVAHVPAVLSDKEYERLSDPEGLPKSIHRREVFDHWFR
ncbi:hypothetical protein BKA65DRAFT_473069 [Rhexocercosporidium sp. MPI-PUGE-AT-0058]|nr:hypothetical protein BKA65DRAFT_473069 [Rhexocercosporidium sp. MPI-PUGE-AT-0058]